MRGIHWWPVDSRHKGPVMWIAFPCHDVIMWYNQQSEHRKPCMFYGIYCVWHDMYFPRKHCLIILFTRSAILARDLILCCIYYLLMFNVKVLCCSYHFCCLYVVYALLQISFFIRGSWVVGQLYNRVILGVSQWPMTWALGSTTTRLTGKGEFIAYAAVGHILLL